MLGKHTIRLPMTVVIGAFVSVFRFSLGPVVCDSSVFLNLVRDIGKYVFYNTSKEIVDNMTS